MVEEQGLHDTLQEVDPEIKSANMGEFMRDDGLKYVGRRPCEHRCGQQDYRPQIANGHGLQGKGRGEYAQSMPKAKSFAETDNPPVQLVWQSLQPTPPPAYAHKSQQKPHTQDKHPEKPHCHGPGKGALQISCDSFAHRAGIGRGRGRGK